MARSRAELKGELQLLAYLHRQIEEVERREGAAAAAPLWDRFHKQAAQVIDEDQPGQHLHLVRLPKKGYLRLSNTGQGGFLRASVAFALEPSIDYGFVCAADLREQLIHDNLRMEDSVHGAISPSNSGRDRFISFCLHAQHQIEPLARYYYDRRGEDRPVAPNARHSTYSSQLYEIGRRFYPNSRGMPTLFEGHYWTMEKLRALRNTVLHRFPLAPDDAGLRQARSAGIDEGKKPYDQRERKLIETGRASELLLSGDPVPVRKALVDVTGRIASEIHDLPVLV